MTITAVLRRWGLLALGVILVVVGLVMASQPATFGWFAYTPLSGAYTPLSDATFMRFPPSLVAMPTNAAVTLVVGLALIAGWVGFRLGRREPRGTGKA